MLSRIIDRVIAKEERKTGTSLTYLREIAGESESAFVKLALALPFTRHRQVLPKTAYHLASIITTQHEDCAECLEMAVQAALKDGVPAHYVRAAVETNFHLLPAPLEEVANFTRTLALGSDNAELRTALRSRYGQKGLVELSFAIAGARLFSTVKRAFTGASACPARPLPLQLI